MNSRSSSGSGGLMRFLLRLLLFVLVLLGVLELFFRFVLPAREYARGYQDPESGVSMFDTTWVRQGTASHGQFCRPMGDWRINNRGWNSMFDYYPRETSERPRIAILGNSYMEGWASDVDTHLDAELFRLLNNEADVYVFGVSGATFAQYLGMIPYIESSFDPDVYMFMLSSFGVSRSLDPSVSPYRFYLQQDENGISLAFPRAVFTQNRYGRVIFLSSLARYLKFNRQAGVTAMNIDIEEIEGVSGSEQELTEDLLNAGLFIISRMDSLLPDHQIILFADGNRNAVYSGIPEYPRLLDYRIFDRLLESSRRYSLVDLTEPFREDYLINGELFSRDYDPHWNSYAHSVAARALLPYVESAMREMGK